MPEDKIQALYEWLDPQLNIREINETLRRLKNAKKGRDIAYQVVSHLRGVGKVNSVSALSAPFIQTLIDLAPNLERGNNVAAVSHHIRNMINDLEWREKERKQLKKDSKKEHENFVILVKNVTKKEKDKIENFLLVNDVDYKMVCMSDFDGNANSNETLFEFKGTAGELYDVLKMIEANFGSDVFDNISLTSVNKKISKDFLTMCQTIFILEHDKSV